MQSEELDEELMQKVKNGDTYAFNIIVRRWEHQVLNLIYKIIGDPEASKDIRQDVFIRVYKSAKRYNSKNHFKTWLYRIAINCSLNEMKKRNRHQEIPLNAPYGCEDGKQQTLEELLPAADPRPDDIVQCEEMAHNINAALQRLPDEQRITVILRHYQSLKFHEIASIMDCPLGTVKSRMRNGLEQLREILKFIYHDENRLKKV